MRDGRAFGFEMQAGGFGEVRIACHDPDPPTRKPRCDGRPQPGVKPGQQFDVADPRTVRRVADDETRWPIRPLDVTGVQVLKVDRIADPRAFRIGCCHADRAGVPVRAVEMLHGDVGFIGGAQFFPSRGIEACEVLKGEVSAASRGEACSDFGGFDQKSPGAAHWVKHGFLPVIPALSQHERGERFAQRGFADGNLVAPFVQAFARGIDAEGDPVVVDPRFQCHICLWADLIAVLFQRGFDPLAGGAGVVDFGFFGGGHLNPEAGVLTQRISPREFAGPLIELGKVKGHEAADPGQHTGRPTQAQVRPPDVFPCTHECHTALG